MKSKKILIVLTILTLIIIPVSIKAVSTIIEKVKVVPDVPEPILQNVPEEAYIRPSNDIFEEETVFSPEFEEKLRKSEEENEARNKKIEEIIRKFKASEYDAQNEYSGEDGYYSEDDIEIKGDKLVLDILENEELTKEEADLLKDFMKDQVSKIKNMPEFVTRIENACK